jgi:hypothetical protein
MSIFFIGNTIGTFTLMFTMVLYRNVGFILIWMFLCMECTSARTGTNKGIVDKGQNGGMMSTSGAKGKGMTDYEDDESPPSVMKGKGSSGDESSSGKGKQMKMGGIGSAKADVLSLRIMSYNIWGAGGNEGKPINETVAAILAADPDIIGIQETRLETEPCTAQYCPPGGASVAESLASALGFYFYDQTQVNAALWSNAVMSRYPILNATKNDLGVELDVDGYSVFAYNLHLTDFPYQPCTSTTPLYDRPCKYLFVFKFLTFFVPYRPGFED